MESETQPLTKVKLYQHFGDYHSRHFSMHKDKFYPLHLTSTQKCMVQTHHNDSTTNSH